jgi:DnaK suppressor protein
MGQISQSDMARFEKRLADQRESLRERIVQDLAESDRENLSNIVAPVRDPGDESIAEATAAGQLTLLRRDVDELHEAEAALTRIREGTYGLCTNCGRDIERQRLEAYPTAERCIDCQADLERKQTGGSDATPTM